MNVSTAATTSERRALFQSAAGVSPFQDTKGTRPASRTSRKPAGVVVFP